MELYRNKSSYPKVNAQENLMGRTHYVDDDTLAFHKSKILSAHAVDKGLLFYIITSDALDYNNTKHGFRYVIFDVFGNSLARPSLEDTYRRREQAEKAMWAKLNTIDAIAVTREAIAQYERNMANEIKQLHDKLNAMESNTMTWVDYAHARQRAREEREARVRAAAPDLLTALKEMMREFDRELDPHEEQPDWLTLARAAIAKAEGEGQ